MVFVFFFFFSILFYKFHLRGIQFSLFSNCMTVFRQGLLMGMISIYSVACWRNWNLMINPRLRLSRQARFAHFIDRVWINDLRKLAMPSIKSHRLRIPPFPLTYMLIKYTILMSNGPRKNHSFSVMPSSLVNVCYFIWFSLLFEKLLVIFNTATIFFFLSLLLQRKQEYEFYMIYVQKDVKHSRYNIWLCVYENENDSMRLVWRLAHLQLNFHSIHSELVDLLLIARWMWFRKIGSQCTPNQ